MKKIIFAILLAVILLSGREFVRKSTPSPIFELEQRTEIEILPKEVHPVLKKINERNSKISSFSCDKIIVRVKRNGISSRVRGSMMYEKDKNFRLRLYSFFGIELDMGSNIDQFWVWSKRMAPRSTLFFANHSDLYKTRLRTPFVPLWIMSALGYREIDPDEVYYKETDEHLILSRHVISPTGQLLIKKAYVDKNTHLIVAYYLYDMEGTEITITQIAYAKNGMPKKIYMRWNEEDVVMDFTFINPRVNSLPGRLCC